MADERFLLRFSSLYFFLLTVSEVKGTLTPSGTVPLDCGSQQTFTCSVTGVAAQWTITGLSGIDVLETSGLSTANNIGRITTTDNSSLTQTSTITITGFTAADNSGTVQCINLGDPAAQGMATVSIGNTLPMPGGLRTTTDLCNVTLEWIQPSTLTNVSTSVTWSPDPERYNECATSPCMISGLNPGTAYNFTVTFMSPVCNSNMSSTMDTTGNNPSCSDLQNVTAVATGPSTVSVTWTPTSVLAMVTCMSPNCGERKCTSPCTISGLMPGTNYMFDVVPVNNCGPATGCPTENMDSAITNSLSSDPDIIPPVVGGIIGGITLLAIIVGGIVIARLVYRWYTRRNRSTPAKPPPAEYADPRAVRDAKEKRKEEKGVTYAALEFSEQAGSTGGQQKVRSKAEPVQYMAVEHA